MSASQWDRYLAALKGQPLDIGERGDPPSGIYRFRPSSTDTASPFAYQRVLRLWRNKAGALMQELNFGAEKAADPDVAWEFFQNQCVAISRELYDQRRAIGDVKAPWPPIHTVYPPRTYNGYGGDKPVVVWTEEWARKTLASDVEHYDENGEPRKTQPGVEAVGANGGPPIEETPLEVKMLERVKKVGEQLAERLKSFGGKPRDEKEGNEVADYQKTLSSLKNEADKARAEEKEPHLRAGKAIDAKYKPAIETAGKYIERTKVILGELGAALDAERKAEAAAKTEAAHKHAERIAKETGEKPAEVKPVEPEKVRLGNGNSKVTLRSKMVATVTDYLKFYTFLIERGAIAPELAEVTQKIAQRLIDADIKNIPGVEQKEVKVAQ